MMGGSRLFFSFGLNCELLAGLMLFVFFFRFLRCYQVLLKACEYTQERHVFGEIFFCRVDKAGRGDDACNWLEVNGLCCGNDVIVLCSNAIQVSSP